MDSIFPATDQFDYGSFIQVLFCLLSSNKRIQENQQQDYIAEAQKAFGIQTKQRGKTTITVLISRCVFFIPAHIQVQMILLEQEYNSCHRRCTNESHSRLT